MKAAGIRDMSRDELVQKLKELRESLFSLKFQHATGRLENTAQITKIRKDIARALTVLTEADRKSKAQG